MEVDEKYWFLKNIAFALALGIMILLVHNHSDMNDHRLGFGSRDNLHAIWDILYFYSLGA